MNYLRYAPLTQLTDRIWLGGLADLQPEGLVKLRELGITHIVSLAVIDEDHPDPHGFTVLRVKQDDGEHIERATLDAFLSWMTTHRDKKVLIHCAAGISRTPSFTIAWFMHERGCDHTSHLREEWSKVEDMIGAVRPIIQPHWKLKHSVLSYFSSK